MSVDKWRPHKIIEPLRRWLRLRPVSPIQADGHACREATGRNEASQHPVVRLRWYW